MRPVVKGRSEGRSEWLSENQSLEKVGRAGARVVVAAPGAKREDHGAAPQGCRTRPRARATRSVPAVGNERLGARGRSAAHRTHAAFRAADREGREPDRSTDARSSRGRTRKWQARARPRNARLIVQIGLRDRHRNAPQADPTGLLGPPSARHHAPRGEVVRLEGRHPGARTDLQAAETALRTRCVVGDAISHRLRGKGSEKHHLPSRTEPSYPNLLGSQGGNTPSGGCFSPFSKIGKRSLRPSLENARPTRIAAGGPTGGDRWRPRGYR
ncbi:MAG: hypothetical protein RI967_1668 [Planctomycetota bacterium]